MSRKQYSKKLKLKLVKQHIEEGVSYWKLGKENGIEASCRGLRDFFYPQKLVGDFMEVHNYFYGICPVIPLQLIHNKEMHFLKELLKEDNKRGENIR